MIEMLLALVLAGLVLGILGQTIPFAARIREAQNRSVARWDELDALERTLRSMIARLAPGGPNGQPGLFEGDAGRLTFTTTLPIATAGQPPRRVDATLAVDSSHRLVLTWQPHAPKPQQADTTRGQSVLLNHIDRLEVAYWDPSANEERGVWQPLWQRPGPPALVRVRIVPLVGNKQHFPDIVVAPERHRWRP